jgi:hypothetical protein
MVKVTGDAGNALAVLTGCHTGIATLSTRNKARRILNFLTIFSLPER